MYRLDATSTEGRRISMPEEEQDDRIYKVVVNHEEQYSIWFADREPPAGWREVGKEGRKEECLAYINEVWTDMRQMSLRKQMEEAEAARESRS
jgi:MbtH protein